MATLPTKLSRRGKQVVKTPASLNTSDDDFEKRQWRHRREDASQEPSLLAGELRCALCGRRFSVEQEAKRNAHLKACAAKSGLDTKQALQVKMLQDKQAQEWKALGIEPKLCASTSSSTKGAAPKKPCATKANDDPRLNLALALSASLTTPKTCLQTRTTEERSRQVSDMVAEVLLGESGGSRQHSDQFIFSHRPASQLLESLYVKSFPLWSAAAENKPDRLDYTIQALRSLHQPKTSPPRQQRVLPKSEECKPQAILVDAWNHVEAKPKLESPASSDLETLSLDLLRLYESEQGYDLTIFTRGQVEIRCHSLILLARCPAMLQDVIVEKSNAPGCTEQRIISWDSVDGDSAKALLRYLYCGQRPSQPTPDLLELAAKFGLLELTTSETKKSQQAEGGVSATQLLDDLLEQCDEQKDHSFIPRSPDLFEDDLDGPEDPELSWKRKLSDGESDGARPTSLCKRQRNTTSSSWNSPRNWVQRGEHSEFSASPDTVQSPCPGLTLSPTNETPSRQSSTSSSSPSESTQSWLNSPILSRSASQPSSPHFDEFDHQASRASSAPPSPASCNIDLDLEDRMTRTPQRTKGSGARIFTPRPDYENMLSPALRRELDKYGLRVIPRHKAIPLLSYIFQETHNPPEGTGQKSGHTVKDIGVPSQSAVDTEGHLLAFLRQDPDLHRSCLTYEPIWLEDLLSKFKRHSGIKCTAAFMMNVLDNECITFRTRLQQKRNTRTSKMKDS